MERNSTPTQNPCPYKTPANIRICREVVWYMTTKSMSWKQKITTHAMTWPALVRQSASGCNVFSSWIRDGGIMMLEIKMKRRMVTKKMGQSKRKNTSFPVGHHRRSKREMYHVQVQIQIKTKPNQMQTIEWKNQKSVNLPHSWSEMIQNPNHRKQICFDHYQQ